MVAFAMFVACVASAQVKEEIQQSKDRSAKLQALCNEYKTCGNANIDGYGNSVRDAALLSIANSEQLETMYKRQIGETVEGVTEVTVTKPTLEEWVAFAATVAGEGTAINAAVQKAKAAGEEAANMAKSATAEKNPMKAAKAATGVVEFGNLATPILVEESAAQVKAVKEIIETLKSDKNL